MVMFQPKEDSSKLVEIQELLDEPLQTELSANLDEEDLAIDQGTNQKTLQNLEKVHGFEEHIFAEKEGN